MSRRLMLRTKEVGRLELFLIYVYGDVWEPTWAPFKDSPFVPLLPVVDVAVMNHALLGWTKPLVEKLGIPPQGALRKIPQKQQVCEHRGHCVFYDPQECVPRGKKMPNCFHPAEMAGEMARQLAYEVVCLWREGVYIVLIKEPPA